MKKGENKKKEEGKEEAKKKKEKWFVFFVKWHINIGGLFNAKTIHVEEQQ